MIYLPIIFFEICSILCLFAPFTFVFCLISAIKKASSDTGNELLNGFFAGLSLLGAGLSLFIMLGGIFYVLL